jgi:hypothetical protein
LRAKSCFLLVLLCLLNLFCDRIYAQDCYPGQYPIADSAVAAPNAAAGDKMFANAFTITVIPNNGSFENFEVYEDNAYVGGGTDTCYIMGLSNPALIPPNPRVSGGDWYIVGNKWSPDYVGWLVTSITYIQSNPGYINRPCYAEIDQRLWMKCTKTATPYIFNAANPLFAYTGLYDLQNCRGAAVQGQVCGNPISY